MHALSSRALLAEPLAPVSSPPPTATVSTAGVSASAAPGQQQQPQAALSAVASFLAAASNLTGAELLSGAESAAAALNGASLAAGFSNASSSAVPPSAADSELWQELVLLREQLLGLAAASARGAGAPGSPGGETGPAAAAPAWVPTVLLCTAEPTQLSGAAQRSAVAALSAAASAPDGVPPSAAAAVVSSLDDVVRAAKSPPSALFVVERPSPQEQQSIFAGVGGAVQRLALSQGARLSSTAAADPPVVMLLADSIQVSVRIADASPDSASNSSIYAQGFSAASSPAAFGPLRRGALGGNATGLVLAQFVYLSFNPLSGSRWVRTAKDHRVQSSFFFPSPPPASHMLP